MFQMVAVSLYLLCATPVSPDVLPDILLSAGFVRIFKLFEVLLPRSVDVSELNLVYFDFPLSRKDMIPYFKRKLLALVKA